MRVDVDGLIVDLEQGFHWPGSWSERPVTVQHVTVELQVRRHGIKGQELVRVAFHLEGQMGQIRESVVFYRLPALNEDCLLSVWFRGVKQSFHESNRFLCLSLSPVFTRIVALITFSHVGLNHSRRELFSRAPFCVAPSPFTKVGIVASFFLTSLYGARSVLWTTQQVRRNEDGCIENLSTSFLARGDVLQQT